MSLYALAIKKASTELLAPAIFLAGVRGYNRDSARSFLRSQPGFLGRNLQPEAARELAAAAAQAGFETMLIAETGVRVPPHPIEADRLELKGNGFNARAGGAITFVPYESVTVLSAAAYDAFTVPDTVQAMEPGVFEKMARLAGAEPPKAPAPRRETFFRADIIWGLERQRHLPSGGERSERLRLLLRPENLDFSPLGPARSPASLSNFRALLDTLSAPCFKAARNAFLEAFLAGRPLTPLKVSGPEAADIELSRLLLLTARR
ncbi:MAG: hypothetical protein HY550_12090 [Elusimicrobia bacterium]|nr:hypothetical protein [Elusimicrobiota bacterium]